MVTARIKNKAPSRHDQALELFSLLTEHCRRRKAFRKTIVGGVSLRFEGI